MIRLMLKAALYNFSVWQDVHRKNTMFETALPAWGLVLLTGSRGAKASPAPNKNLRTLIKYMEKCSILEIHNDTIFPIMCGSSCIQESVNTFSNRINLPVA